MKKVLGIAAFALIFSVPAHGQMSRGGGGAGSVPGASANGSASSGGYSLSGSTVGPGLSSYPRARLDTTAVSGGDPSYAPSTFMSFEQAVAEGNAENAARKTLAQVAAENISAPKAKAKFAFVQDANGRVVPVAHQ
jgi:hypothetical protein